MYLIAREHHHLHGHAGTWGGVALAIVLMVVIAAVVGGKNKGGGR